MKIKVLVVDDSAVVRVLLKHLFTSDDRFELCGTAENGQDAVEKNSELNPDFIVMDLNMPIMDGIEASRQILAKSNPAIVAFTTEDYASVSYRSYEVGILEVIIKPNLANMKKTSLEEFADRLFFIAQTHKIKKEKFENSNSEKKETLEKFDNFANENLKENFIDSSSNLITDENKLLQEKTDENDKSFISHGVSETEDLKSKTFNRGNLKTENKKNIFDKKKCNYRLLAIGSSTGGPVALKNVLCGLGEDFPLPVIVTQHNDENFDEVLCLWLSRTTGMKVKLARNGDSLTAGYVYIAPNNFHLTILEQNKANETYMIRLTQDEPVNFLRPSVDKMFESSAEICGSKVISVLLTGMGKDGAAGSLLIKKKGGFTIAEAEEDCVIFGMPKAAIDSGAICEVLKLNRISKVIWHKLYEKEESQ